MYSDSVGELFDLAETRRGLQARRAELLAECTANAKLQRRFDAIAAQLTAPGEKAARSKTSAARRGLSGGGGSGESGSEGMYAIPTVNVGAARGLHSSSAAEVDGEDSVTSFSVAADVDAGGEDAGDDA